MKRTPLHRKTRLKAGTKRLKVRRRSKRFAARRDPAYATWVRSGLCLIGDQCFGTGVDACHVKSRGAGGDDRGNLIPLCRSHHREQHQIGLRSFERKYGVDLMAHAQHLATVYQSKGQGADA